MRVQDVIHKPVITEKALDKGQNNEYVFDVSLKASKHQIAAAVEALFKVEVDTVKTLVRKGKSKRAGSKRLTKKLPDVKKAYVTLKKGSIDVVPKA